MLENLSFSPFKAYFRVVDPIRLPQYTGSVFHDALGQAFWKTRYGMKESCRGCPIRSACRYEHLRVYFFKSPSDHPFIREAHEALSRQMRREEYPQPFVFDPAIGGKYGAGDLLVLPFALMGKAIECFPFMACALSRMCGKELGCGARRVTLEAIVGGWSSEGGESVVYDAARGLITGPGQVIDFEMVRQWVLGKGLDAEGVRKARLRFMTPFRCKAGGRLGAPLTFETFMKSLLRRLTLLSVHSPFSFEIDYRHLLSLAVHVTEDATGLKWVRRRRTPRIREESMNLDGYQGEISFSGDLTPFLPYLKMGELLNVGKAASFGCGKYSLFIEA